MIAQILKGLPVLIGGGVLGAFLVSTCDLAGVEWAWPGAFWLLLFVFPLVWQRHITGQNTLAVAKVAGTTWSIRGLLAWIPDVLKIAGLILLITALARPRLTHKDEIIESQGLDILLAIDTSGSMHIEDMRTRSGMSTRLDVAKGVAKEFIDGRPHDRVGVVVFGEEAFTHVPLTLDHDTLNDVIDSIEIGMAGGRGTAVGTAIAVSAKRMKELKAPDRVIILVTDGRSNAGRLSPQEAATAAKALGIRVYTIGVGAPVGFGDEGIDEAMMTEVAKMTGGQYFRATDMKALESVYKTIDELEPSPAKVKQLVEHEERFRGLLMWGALLLFVQALLSATIFRRGP